MSIFNQTITLYLVQLNVGHFKMSSFGRESKIPRLDVGPSTSKKSQAVQNTQEIEKCFEKLKEVFPLATEDHLHFHAKKIAGNQDALEDFIVKHLDKEIEGPVLDNDYYLKILTEAFPHVDSNFLQEHVINTCTDETQKENHVENWIKHVLENNLLDYLPKKEDQAIQDQSKTDSGNDSKLQTSKALSKLCEMLPNVDPNFLGEKVTEFAGKMDAINAWVQEMFENDTLFTLPSIKDTEDQKRRAEFRELKQSGIEGLEQCPFCPYFAILESKPEVNKVFNCQECKKDSCRLCKKLSHIPLRCDEVIDKIEKKPFESIQDKFLANGENKVTFKQVFPSRSVDLTSEDIEYRLVESAFHRLAVGDTCKITSIEFVINPELQRKFEAKKAEFKQRNIPDKVVFGFHGTRPENIKSICKTNLNVINRQWYGYGYCLSEYPDFSLGYGAGLLMFKVLPGNEYLGTDHFSHYGPNAQYQCKKITSYHQYNNFVEDQTTGYMVRARGVNNGWQKNVATGNNKWIHQKQDYGFELIIVDNAQFVPYCIIHLK